MKDETYIPVKDSDGQDYLCPVTTVTASEKPARGAHADCVEKDVTERYSGNFSVKK
jgi:hypothetical protein